MTIQAAAELKNYGVSVNAIAPAARTRMTVGAGGAMAEAMAAPEEGFDAMLPRTSRRWSSGSVAPSPRTSRAGCSR